MNKKPIEMREMPKEIRLTNVIRKVTLILSWIGVIVFIILFTQDDRLHKALVPGIMAACTIHGLVHLELVFSKLNRFMGRLGLFIILVFGVIFVLPPYAFLMVVGWYAGGIFLIVDTILFIMKKPLIYRFELKGYIGNILYKMTKSMNNGMMTVEDFQANQAELLSLI